MNRDWNKDKELPSFSYMLMRLAKANERAIAEKERADKAEAREKKLREAIENQRETHRIYGRYQCWNELTELLASLYPKEEEAK